MDGDRAVRERTEELERASLSTWACLVTDTKGRDVHEDPDALRTAYQVDRDRLLASAAFARLAGKTHLAVGGDGAVVRTRLDHTLAVTSAARTVARALRLNEDLVEAIAVGHDVGHTAFGRAGEPALSVFTEAPFRHHEQSLRVVERLEGGRGLNLTWEVRDGILHHSVDDAPPATLEGQVVRLADRFAGLASDLQDAVRAGVLTTGDVPAEVRAALGGTHAERLGRLAADVVTASWDAPEARHSERVAAALDALEAFLDERLHGRPAARMEHARAEHCLQALVVFLLEHPHRLPAQATRPQAPAEPPLVPVLDVVAGLTDAEARQLFDRHLLPHHAVGRPAPSGPA